MNPDYVAACAASREAICGRFSNHPDAMVKNGEIWFRPPPETGPRAGQAADARFWAGKACKPLYSWISEQFECIVGMISDSGPSENCVLCVTGALKTWQRACLQVDRPGKSGDNRIVLDDLVHCLPAPLQGMGGSSTKRLGRPRMKMIKMALLGGAAMAVTAASAHADDLDALKAQIETLNARVAAMETAPSVPAGFKLIAVSEGELPQTPGLGMTAQELAGYGNRATIISVLPTADAPAGTTITWSGYARAGLVFESTTNDTKVDRFSRSGNDAAEAWNDAAVNDYTNDDSTDDVDVKARGQLRVKASTDTAVGEVGVDIRLRGNFNGNGAADVYTDVAWGYWAMTPELTFGGGYAGSLGNIGYGYDGACTCYYTDNADLAFNPGDVTQMRLSYASGPVSFAISLEDASIRAGGDNFSAADSINGDELGAAGEIKYSGDTFSGEIAGVWRGINEDAYGTFKDGDVNYAVQNGDIDSLWQVGAGLGFALGDVANLSVAAAMGEGPFTTETDGNLGLSTKVPVNNSWWGITALASFKMSDEFHAELGAGYKKREGDDITAENSKADVYQLYKVSDIEYDTYGVLGGVYYQPVDQLTIGVEAEWYTTDTTYNVTGDKVEGGATDTLDKVSANPDTFSIDLVSVWRF